MATRFDSFIEALAEVQHLRNVTNQYAYGSEDNAIRRANLGLYLEQMLDLCPNVLVIGEAPGYRGCRLTGVPFTSEFIILDDVCRCGLFGQAKGYRKASPSRRLCKEQSATIVWETLARLPKVPLLWNAFPFHPYKTGNRQSNRMPDNRELEIGRRFLAELARLFDIAMLVAVGNTADTAVKAMGIQCCKIRHPAHGGKREFVEGVHSAMRLRM